MSGRASMGGGAKQRLSPEGAGLTPQGTKKVQDFQCLTPRYINFACNLHAKLSRQKLYTVENPDL
jgi:hypothetical protein